jgi:hypothetical protein
MKLKMGRISSLLIITGFMIPAFLNAQTVVPNGGFETWVDHSSYEDPVNWDTPNQEVATIPIFGTPVVSKSTDHNSGLLSAKLETKHITIPPLDVPGLITLGNLTINISQATFQLTGGVPISDHPTHLQGFYKYIPKGGDSCVIGIGLFKFQAGNRDTIASGYFTTKDTLTDWTPFSAWIEYTESVAPDTMNIFALSTAQETGMHPGTTLYVDDISLDYTVSVNREEANKEIRIYQDNETKRLLVFFDYPEPVPVTLSLFDIRGTLVSGSPEMMIGKEKKEIAFGSFPKGIYLLNIQQPGNVYCRKFLLNF